MLDRGGRASVATPLGEKVLWISRKIAERGLVRLEGQGLPARERPPARQPLHPPHPRHRRPRKRRPRATAQVRGGLGGLKYAAALAPAVGLRLRTRRHVAQHLRPSLPRHHLGREPRAGAGLRGRRLPAGHPADRGRHPGLARQAPARARASSSPSARSRTRCRSSPASSRTTRTGGQVTTGTPISMIIENVDQRSRDYREIADKLPARPRRLRLLRQVRRARLPRRRAPVGARDGGAGGGRRHRAQGAGRRRRRPRRRSSRSVRMRSTAPAGTGTRSDETRSGARTRPWSRSGRRTSRRSARPAPPPAPSSRSRRPACRPAGARRSMASSTPSSRAR